MTLSYWLAKLERRDPGDPHFFPFFGSARSGSRLP
ncbi:hypothetical protein CYA_0538 [Synechococcus sp. JA-3-3Ab]|nr:hypothetical protein CYA_0538 [Synechococcus sp. JA-3-3Ab]